METAINNVLAQMQSILDASQLKHLAEVLRIALLSAQHVPAPRNLLTLFLTAKEVEGCSSKTISYYESTLRHMTDTVAKPYTQMTSDDLREYLNNYENERNAGKVTIDNIRRIMSSFFAWLEDEDYIVKSPVRRIHRVKTAVVAKETLSDENLETLRDECDTLRDLAVVDILASTGMRVGELVGLDIADVNLQERECLVTGKGNKQRPVYFDARTKLHLTAYLRSRADNNPALFVSLNGSGDRISIGGVESRLRQLGKKAGVNRVHPHKFRRTLATHAIDKGNADRTGAKTARTCKNRHDHALRHGQPKQRESITQKVFGMTRLGDVCEKIGSGATPRGGKEAYKETGIPIIRSQNVHDWAFQSSGLAFLDDEQAKALANGEVHSNDILLNITGDSVARACEVPAEHIPARVNQHVAIIRAGKEINPTYLLAFLQFKKAELLNLASSGATRNALTKKMIENLDIDLPSRKEQDSVATLLDSIQSKIAINAQLNDYLPVA